MRIHPNALWRRTVNMMVDLGATMFACALALLVLMLAGWLLSLPLRDVSIVDVIWGLGFVLVAWVSFAVAGGDGSRRFVTALLATIWGLRLAGYIGRRKLRHPGEDPRYGAWRERHGARFALVSLPLVFLFQGLLVWLVGLALMGSAASSDGLGALAIAGIAVWAVGLFFEAVGDAQMAAFKRDPANRGTVMDRGLWRYTRHPNYFGDCCVWWGLWLVALDAGAWWSVGAPLIMTLLLTRVSGRDHLERSMSRRPGYDDYVARTSGFIPRPPLRRR
jgi:steroid 5-alpha reductase family enzyme